MDVSKVPFLKNVNTLDSLVDNYRRCLGKKDIEIATNLKLPKLQKYKKWVRSQFCLFGRFVWSNYFVQLEEWWVVGSF